MRRDRPAVARVLHRREDVEVVVLRDGDALVVLAENRAGAAPWYQLVYERYTAPLLPLLAAAQRSRSEA